MAAADAALYKKDLELDVEAERLIRDVEGADPSESLRGFSVPGLAERLFEEQKRIDFRGRRVVEFMYEAAESISCAKAGMADKTELCAQRMLQALNDIGDLKDHDGGLLIRYRGRGIAGEGLTSVRNDYNILFGGVRLDARDVQALAQRLGNLGAHLPGRFAKAAANLSRAGINTLFFNLFREGEDLTGLQERSVQAMVKYFYTRGTEEGLCEMGRMPCIPLINDELGADDPNLSILAAANKLSQASANAMINKVHAMMEKAGPQSPLAHYAAIFGAIFAFSKLKDQLEKPSVQVNNLRWLMTFSESESLSTLQARLARLVSAAFGTDSPKSARTISCLYATDYDQLDAYMLVDRLKLLTDLLRAARKQVKDSSPMEKKILDLFAVRMESVPALVLNSLAIDLDEVSALTPWGETIKRSVDPILVDMVMFFHQRIATRRKVKAMISRNVALDELDYGAIAREFSIDSDEARQLVNLLQDCFDSQGHFLKNRFEKNLPAFVLHERVFDFLWHYLKEHMHRHERVVFLNSLQLLIDKMSQPLHAIGVLLEDFSQDPESVYFSDRNCLMLCNLLLRRYNKELHANIETTPEEVLNVQEGLDPQRVIFARKTMDTNRERFFMKVRTIHQEIMDVLDPYRGSRAMPSAYLLSLEREAFLLFSLVGGVVGVAALRHALRTYGNPGSQIYHLGRSQDLLPSLLGNLQVIIRGVSRSGERSDKVLLSELKSHTLEFQALKKGKDHRSQVKRVLDYAARG